MYKNVASQKLAIYAWDGASGAAKTGDAANITVQISKDGGACATSNDVNPTELDAVDAPGIYVFDLTQAETNCDIFIGVPVSSTADVVIRPVITYTENDISVSDVLGGTIEGTLTLQKAISTILAFVAGKTSGGGTRSIKFRNQDDDTNRITMTVDSDGDRSEVTIDVSDL